MGSQEAHATPWKTQARPWEAQAETWAAKAGSVRPELSPGKLKQGPGRPKDVTSLICSQGGPKSGLGMPKPGSRRPKLPL